MLMRCVAPSEHLKPFVNGYYIICCDASERVVQRLVPDGCIGMNFCRRNGLLYGNQGHIGSCIGGQQNGYFDVIAEAGTEIIGVEFKPYGAQVFFDFPISLLGGKILAISDLGDSSLTHLERMVASMPTISHSIAAIEGWLTARLEVSRVDMLNLRRVASSVARAIEGSDVDAMAQAACVGVRHIDRLFAAMVGTTPKQYVRIRRFHRAMELIHRGIQQLADVAWAAGYYDVSHMIREFRMLGGYTPRQFNSATYGECRWLAERIDSDVIY
ncbi:MAG: helix-turn-helix domain-containing protein [Muribaculaceae bacterium]